VHTNQSGTKYFQNVYFISELPKNLLNIGQPIESEYSILFENNSYVIKDKITKQTSINVNMTTNKIFSLEKKNDIK
jgi:uncharacterized secreted protein with C-terminal beta-propeller domain